MPTFHLWLSDYVLVKMSEEVSAGFWVQCVCRLMDLKKNTVEVNRIVLF
jgi:hypothetical protein